MPRSRLKSRAKRDWKASSPSPGQANTDSTTTEPPSKPPTCTPATVTTGRTALRSTWVSVIRSSFRPLARAVVT